MSCPVKKWCLLSGGKDSATVAHLLAERGELAGCLSIDTGISTPDWRPFVEDLAAQQGWPLEVIRTPVSYDALVRKYGFPGPTQHRIMFHALKARAIRIFKKRHPGAVLASGVRKKESARRKKNVPLRGTLEGLRVEAPISTWTTERVWAYVREHNLPRSPAYETLHISGDCLCGAYARREEAYLIQMFYPDVAARLRALEEDPLVRARRIGRKWGHGNGAESFDMKQSRVESFLCASCLGDGT